MKAFKRLDHLLCDVPDIEAAFQLFTQDLGFPVAWPIGRFWPEGRTSGIALGGANLELIQLDDSPLSEARIQRIAFQPTRQVGKVLHSLRIAFTVYDKLESNPELLALRGMPTNQGRQRLCTNTIPEVAQTHFLFFACNYSAAVRARLSPEALRPTNGNELLEVRLGHPQPKLLQDQLGALGIESGVPITVVEHAENEVVALRMKHGPLPLPSFPSRFRFV